MWGNQQGFEDGGGMSNTQQAGQGGGYMASQGGFGSPTPTQTRVKRAQNLIPCTIAQILSSKAVEEGFKCGLVDLHQVSLVGVIINTETQATHIRYELDDMSGPALEVKQWTDNEENDKPDTHQPGTYVKIIGSVRTFGGKTTVSPFKIAPLTDLNEITLHMLEVVHAHMYVTKKKNQTEESTTGPSGMNTNTPNKAAGNQGNDNSNIPNHGLNNVQTQVHQLIVACQDDQGISLNLLRGSLKGISVDLIREAVEFLSNEGHIYSTIDDDHFKSTES